MLKLYILSRRKNGMTHEQYVTHWRDVHGPMFASQPDTKKYVRRYIQSRITPDIPKALPITEVDGIVQLWFDDIAGMNAFFDSPSYKNVIQPDELRFTEPSRCEFFLANEVPIIW